MEQIDWSSLYRILGDSTRRNLLELLSEKGALSYTEIMALLGITNTGRLNYHLKTLNGLLTKDDEGKYRLTERGRLVINLLQTFPERERKEKEKQDMRKAVATCVVLFGVLLIVGAAFFAIQSLVAVPSAGNLHGQVIPQNTSKFIGWLTPLQTETYSIHWGSPVPLSIYVLNANQTLDLEQQYTGSDYFLANFTGTPSEFTYKCDLSHSSASLTLPLGNYYLCASSNTTVVLDSLTITTPQWNLTASSPIAIEFEIAGLSATGIIVITIGVLVFTRRVWL